MKSDLKSHLRSFASSQAQAWEFGLEALAFRFAKLELRLRGSQSGDWEPAYPLLVQADGSTRVFTRH